MYSLFGNVNEIKIKACLIIECAYSENEINVNYMIVQNCLIHYKHFLFS